MQRRIQAVDTAAKALESAQKVKHETWNMEHVGCASKQAPASHVCCWLSAQFHDTCCLHTQHDCSCRNIFSIKYQGSKNCFRFHPCMHMHCYVLTLVHILAECTWQVYVDFAGDPNKAGRFAGKLCMGALHSHGDLASDNAAFGSKKSLECVSCTCFVHTSYTLTASSVHAGPRREDQEAQGQACFYQHSISRGPRCSATHAHVVLQCI
jgi:hypothetical protein